MEVMVTTLWLSFAAHSSRLGAAAVCRKHVSFATLGGLEGEGGRPTDPHHLDPPLLSS